MAVYLRELTRHRAARIDGEFSVLAQAARSSAWQLDGVAPDDQAALDRILQGTLAQSELIYGSAIAFDPGLRRVAPYLYRPGGETSLRRLDIGRDAYDYTSWDWFRLPREAGSPVWVEPYFDKGAGNVLMVTYGVPLSRQGQFRAVLTVDVSLERLRADMSRVEVPNGFVALASRRGVFLSHPRPDMVMHESVAGVAAKLDLPELAAAATDMASGRSGVVRLLDPNDGEGMSWLVYAPIASTGWSLMALVEEEKVLAQVNQRLQRQLLVSLAGAVLVLLILLLTTVRITRPLVRLGETARQVAGGNLAARAQDVSGHDEIGRFATVFNRMLDELDAATAARIREAAARQAVESELKVALEIQRSLLPHVFPPFPDHSEFELYAICNPALSMSGDFYDFFLLDENTLVLLIADVCGKGVPAAMFMAVARTTLRNLGRPGLSPAQVLEAANQALVAENEQGMFVTLFLAHYDLASGALRYAGAGHPPPCLVRSDGEVARLPSHGGLFGVFAEARYEMGESRLEPGDALVLYTDGVTEAHDAGGTLYGEARLATLLQDAASQPAESICRAVVADVDAYRADGRQDDVTLLVLRRTA
ncbi:SpoIIE family protein phosphatase [Sulfurisoma sediminicola]|uniref:Sigma-B regulation protein RsbU (Phosphoserine phosphatase) n=1 Tax=Sulfurisoma sediminicola TaxID=1381557 RepID=A0A497X9Z3_9PROT|nr:SpoIIE family protein phosphatase [Sulfurisoma sediminicola]RLJ62667.1 sigma-B regulation protein RsbU (phosphoserine phosphatase) [Sulfurisoma sediminicola]